MLDDAWRSIAHGPSDTNYTQHCDWDLSGWYRFKMDGKDANITTECVDVSMSNTNNSCGSCALANNIYKNEWLVIDFFFFFSLHLVISFAECIDICWFQKYWAVCLCVCVCVCVSVCLSALVWLNY